jgi:hypothetical protein
MNKPNKWDEHYARLLAHHALQTSKFDFLSQAWVDSHRPGAPPERKFQVGAEIFSLIVELLNDKRSLITQLDTAVQEALRARLQAYKNRK